MNLAPLKKQGKKAAIEMSVGTMVIIVISVVLLVLALIFVRRIFSGATYNVDQLNDAVRGEINKLFGQEGQKAALFLPGNTAKVKPREAFGVAFGIRNIDPSGKFNYQVQATEVSSTCSGISIQQANNWIVLGKTGEISIASGDTGYGLVKVNVPANANVGCQVRFSGEVTKEGSEYTSFFFDVEVEARGAGGLF